MTALRTHVRSVVPTSDPVERNEPHVCTFHVHGLNFDAASTGTWSISGQGGGNVAGSGSSHGTWGPASASGEWRTSVMTLPSGHYELSVEQTTPAAPGGEKHKVFWVECQRPPTAVGQAEESRTALTAAIGGGTSVSAELSVSITAVQQLLASGALSTAQKAALTTSLQAAISAEAKLSSSITAAQSTLAALNAAISSGNAAQIAAAMNTAQQAATNLNTAASAAVTANGTLSAQVAAASTTGSTGTTSSTGTTGGTGTTGATIPTGMIEGAGTVGAAASGTATTRSSGVAQGQVSLPSTSRAEAQGTAVSATTTQGSLPRLPSTSTGSSSDGAPIVVIGFAVMILGAALLADTRRRHTLSS